jgi:hypothetical protein
MQCLDQRLKKSKLPRCDKSHARPARQSPIVTRHQSGKPRTGASAQGTTRKPQKENGETKMDYNGQAQDDTNAMPAQATEAAESGEMAAGGLGIADVLFPARPPVPANARLIRGFSFHDEAKPRGLAGAAGYFASKQIEFDSD